MRTRQLFLLALAAVVILFLAACGVQETRDEASAGPAPVLPPPFKQNKYATVSLTPDLQTLSADDRGVLPRLSDALDAIDLTFWLQVYGPKSSLLDSIPGPDARRFAEINYGPWDRLDEDKPFFPVRPKPATSRFYPLDLQPGELEQAGAVSADGGASLRNPFTVVHRDKDKTLQASAYHEVYAPQMQQAAALLRQAGEKAGNSSLRRYLELRADALITDSYALSDKAWMEIDGPLGVVIGPMDPGEDHIYRVKRAYTGALWIARPDWDARLERLRSLLESYAEKYSLDRRVKDRPAVTYRVVDLIQVAGSWNAGPKRIVLELPVDEAQRGELGTRRLQLHNVARAKYDSTLVPLAEVLIAEKQRRMVTFDAFFVNELLSEMIRAEGTGRRAQALRRIYGDAAWVVEIVRANVIGAHLAGLVAEQGITGANPEEHYTTLVASAFRSLRFGSASAQGPASLILLNHLKRDGAIERDATAQSYRIDVKAMQRSLGDLAERLAAANDPAKADELRSWLGERTASDPELIRDLQRLALARVPIDVAFTTPSYPR